MSPKDPAPASLVKYRAYIDGDLYTRAVHVLSGDNPPLRVGGTMGTTAVVEAVVADWLRRVEKEGGEFDVNHPA